MSATADIIRADLRQARKALEHAEKYVDLLDADDGDAWSQAKAANEKLDETRREYEDKLKGKTH